MITSVVAQPDSVYVFCLQTQFLNALETGWSPLRLYHYMFYIKLSTLSLTHPQFSEHHFALTSALFDLPTMYCPLVGSTHTIFDNFK